MVSRLLSCLVAVGALPSAACPVCDTVAGRQVRAGILDGNVALALASLILPFAVVVGVALGIHFGVPGTRRKRGERD